jgi:hypothetical protein
MSFLFVVLRNVVSLSSRLRHICQSDVSVMSGGIYISHRPVAVKRFFFVLFFTCYSCKFDIKFVAHLATQACFESL